MRVVLKNRTEADVRIYYEKVQQPEIKAMLPQEAKSVEEALGAYRKTLLPGSTSFGHTIYADDEYVGDIWCYGIDRAETPNAMLSFCIFETAYWNRGITSKAVSLFLKEIRDRYEIETIGAFTYFDNSSSQRVLAKNGFQLMEEFTEDGKKSRYYQLTF
jgi:hypothetical protein|nr:GNAT family N-acetyltransferase [uncultured Stomatobaculum sp.]